MKSKTTVVKKKGFGGIVKEKVVVNKVKPYPIPTEIKKKGKPLKGDIRRLSEHGCLLVSIYDFYRIGDVVDISFRLPVLKTPLDLTGKVVKSYTPVEAPTKAGMVPNVVMVELHFSGITVDQAATIKAFREKIGQKE